MQIAEQEEKSKFNYYFFLLLVVFPKWQVVVLAVLHLITFRKIQYVHFILHLIAVDNLKVLCYFSIFRLDSSSVGRVLFLFGLDCCRGQEEKHERAAAEG